MYFIDNQRLFVFRTTLFWAIVKLVLRQNLSWTILLNSYQNTEINLYKRNHKPFLRLNVFCKVNRSILFIATENTDPMSFHIVILHVKLPSTTRFLSCYRESCFISSSLFLQIACLIWPLSFQHHFSTNSLLAMLRLAKRSVNCTETWLLCLALRS